MSSIKYKNGSGNWEDIGNTGIAATTSTYGVVKLATQAEALAGTDDKKVITAKTLNDVSSGISTELADEILRSTQKDTELENNIGTLSNLTTSDKTDLVSAINSEVSRATSVEGTLSSLTTSDKTDLVSAINSEVSRATSAEGTLSNLTTSDKTDLVSAINSEVSRATGIEAGLRTDVDKKVDKVSTANRIYGTDASGNQTTYDQTAFGYVDDVKINNESIVHNKVVNLGTMALETATDYALDNNTVHKTGNETIGGDKTFNNYVQTKSHFAVLNADNAYARYYAGCVEFMPTTTQTHGGYVDFHYAGDSSDYTARIIEQYRPGELHYVGAERFTQDTSTSSGVIATKGWSNLYKQDKLSTAQMNAVNSGITSALVTQIGTNQTNIGTNTSDIATINSKIPNAASTTNQLADKEFVNSSIQTATASFDGNWNTYALIPTTVAGFTSENLPEPTINNYLIVKEDETQDGGTWRYKYTPPSTTSTYDKSYWQAEYEINDTPFTQAQLDAINSGATTSKINKILDDVQLNGVSVIANGVANVTSDNTTISSNTNNKLQSIGVIDKNSGDAYYDWIGTSAQYATQWANGTIQPTWVCYITDDESGPLSWGTISGNINNQTDLIQLVQTEAGLPSQAGNSGKFLTTNGTTAEWATVDALPSQSGNNGYILTTDGTDASWINPTSLTAISNKVDKVSTANKIYGTNGSGGQTTFTLSNSNGNNTVAYRTSTGTLRVSDPTDNKDAVSLSYLNSALTGYQTTANLDSSLSSSTTKYPSSKAVKDVTDLLATDSNVVHLTGNETIAGTKTFTSAIVVATSSPVTTFENTGYSKGTVPTADKIIYNFKGSDSNDETIIYDYNYIEKNTGKVKYIKRLYDNSSASATGYRDVITADFNGTTSNLTIGSHTANAPTPSTTTSTTDTYIATTGWVNTRKQDKLSTAQTNAVNSGITSALVGQIGQNQTDIGTLSSQVDGIETSLALYQTVANLETSLSTSDTKYPSSNAVKTAIQNIDALPSQTGKNGKYLKTNGNVATWEDVTTTTITYDSSNKRLTFTQG